VKTLKQLCMPRQSVFDRSRRDVVLDLTDLIDREGHIDPHEFFEENYLFTEWVRQFMLATSGQTDDRIIRGVAVESSSGSR